jgi:nucleotidyltransferase/DNA polymerase involved in DNA repair
MIGDSTAPVLIQQGIKTIGDLAKKKNILILKQFFSKN